MDNLPLVKVIEPSYFTDHRGDLWTIWREGDHDLKFNHDKVSVSKKNVIRGIHGDDKSWKLVTCLYGEIYFVVVNPDNDTWDYIILTGDNKKIVLVPPTYGNGHCVLSEHAVFMYKWSYEGDYPDVGDQFTIRWNDPKLGVDWPIDDPILSNRDRIAPIRDNTNNLDFYEMYNKEVNNE